MYLVDTVTYNHFAERVNMSQPYFQQMVYRWFNEMTLQGGFLERV